MSGLVRGACILVGLAAFSALPQTHAQEGKAVAVEPADLTRRPDLVGREIVVDDRVARFQFHPNTGFDEVYLKRAPEVTFQLPPRLRPAHNPQAAGVQIRGVLRHAEGRWWCDVAELTTLPSDIDRVNSGVAQLVKSDVEKRLAWARWAEARGREFDDDALTRRGREIEAEVIRFESDNPPPGDSASHWLALADRARSRKLAEPEASALAHRGFRAALAQSKTAEELKSLLKRVEAFFPAASRIEPGAPSVEQALSAYLKNPAESYRRAVPGVRAALDHRLWGDTVQRWLERRSVEEPNALIGLADEASRLLPDRPDFARSILEKGVESASADVGALRQNEVDTLARLLRESLHQPDKAQALYRAWLDDQKTRRISPRDSEARIALAEQYETLLNDRATAVSLLREAWKIDPQSREVADAFRRRNFRKEKDDWVNASESKPAAAGPRDKAGKSDPDPDQPDIVADRNGRSDTLRNATPDEVRTRMGGKPNQKVLVATQGQLTEQWIYVGAKQNQFITFVKKPGETFPRVISYYSLPRSDAESHHKP